MSARATIREADLNRAVKVAARNGLRVMVRGQEIHFLPMTPEMPLPSDQQAEDEWDRALGLQS